MKVSTTFYVPDTPISEEIEEYREKEALMKVGLAYAEFNAKYEFQFEYYDERQQRTLYFNKPQDHPNLIYRGKIITVWL